MPLVKRIPGLVKMFAVYLIGLSCQPVAAAPTSPDRAIELGLKYEAEGNYPSALAQYRSVAGEYGSSMPTFVVSHDLACKLNRRLLIMEFCCIKTGQGQFRPPEVCYYYDRLSELEPDNPAWPYLKALVSYKAMNNPNMFFGLMHQAMNCKGGSESVRKKVIAGYEKLKPEVNAAIRQQNNYVKKEDWDWDHGGKQRYERGMQAAASVRAATPVQRSGTKPSGGAYDYGASQNAQAAGDWGAASRLGNGSGTWNDKNTYGH